MPRVERFEDLEVWQLAKNVATFQVLLPKRWRKGNLIGFIFSDCANGREQKAFLNWKYIGQSKARFRDENQKI